MASYLKLAEDLKGRISDGALKRGSRLDSLRKLADREGLCVTTVAKAVDVLVEEGLLKKVDRKGFFVAKDRPRPTPVKKVGIWGPFDPRYVFAGTGDGAVPRTLDGFQPLITEKGFRTSLHNCHCRPYNFDSNRPWRYVTAEEVEDYGLDGLLMVNSYDLQFLSTMTALQIPLVTVDMDATALGFDSVWLDNVAAAYDLTRALIEKGHKHIAYIGGPTPEPYLKNRAEFDPSAVDRAEGYRLAMRAHMPTQPTHVFHTKERGRTDEGCRVLAKALQELPDCTAVISESIPRHEDFGGREIASAGFAPKGRADFEKHPGLMAFAECDFREMGRRASEMLVARMEEPKRPLQMARMMPDIRIRSS